MKMNKEMKEYFIKSVNDDPHSTKGWASFDTWGNPKRAYLFSLLKDESLIMVDDVYYYCIFEDGNGICTMGGSPDSVIVTRLNFDDVVEVFEVFEV